MKFKQCPNYNDGRKYKISGEKGNIITKVDKTDNIMGIICENELEKKIEYKWKITILKTKDFCINIGVTPIDFDLNSNKPYQYGWYFYCKNRTLYSGTPHNYLAKATNFNKVKKEIIVIMNMNKRTLQFIIDNEDKGISYTDIPIDKPLCPIVTLLSYNDSIEINEC